jgi:hypothetical protein
MELVEWKKSKKGLSNDGFMLRMDEKEAISLVNSITNQLMSGNPNTGRREFPQCRHQIGKKKREVYFSVAIHNK